MLAAVVPCCGMTIEEDRSEVERIAASWQDVPGLEQEAMLARLGAMLEYLDPAEDPNINFGGTSRG